MKKLLLFTLVSSVVALAQSVTGIRYVGLNQLSPQVANEIADIHIGDTISAGKVNETIKNLFAQGYFRDIKVEQKGGVLIYHVTEKPSVANISVEGYGTSDDGDTLKNVMSIKKGELYDESRAKESKTAIVKYLEQKGYYDTAVSLETKQVGKNAVELNYRVNKGEELQINTINFIGRKHVSQSELENALANKERDYMGWLPFLNDGKVNTEQLKYDALRVTDVYRQHGYLDAIVEEPLMRVDFGSYDATIDYKVSEGRQYRVGDVSISQNIKGLHNSALFSEIRLSKGKIFNIERLRKDIKILEEMAGNVGYAYAKVHPQMKKNLDATVDVTYVISEGKPVKINDVLIAGNTNTQDRVIRRYMYLAPGDTYNAKDLRDSKNALGRTGFFDKAEVETQRMSDDKVNLLVNVDEANTGSISLGGGYGSYEGFMFNSSYAQKNIWGSGISGEISADISKISNSYFLSLTNPKLFDSDYSLGFSFSKKYYEYPNFTNDSLNARITLGKEFARYFHHSIGIGYVDAKSEASENNNTSAFQNNIPVSEFYRLFYNDKYEKTSLYYNMVFNNTDHHYVPREGVIASVNFEFANLTGDEADLNLTAGSGEENGYGSLTKVQAKFGAYYGLKDWIDYDLIFRAKARYRHISVGENEKLPVAEKFFMGGITSVRGFEPYSISPVIDPSDPTSGRTGGTKSASFSLEASIPLSEAAKMRLTGFVDYGMIGEEEIDEITRSSYGVQIEWFSQFGPLNLVFAKPFNEKEGDRTSIFEFSMGTRF